MTPIEITYNTPVPIDITLLGVGIKGDKGIQGIPGATYDDTLIKSQLADNVTQLGLKITKGSFFYNTKDYGAKGDGITDDAPAINAFIATLDVNKSCTIYFPDGKYLIKSTIIIPYLSTYWTMCGNGSASILKLGANCDLVSFQLPPTGSAVNRFTFRNLCLDGDSRIGSSILLKAQGFSQLDINNIFFLRIPTTGAGLYVAGNGVNTSHDNHISKLYFDTTTGLACIQLASTSADLIFSDIFAEGRFGVDYIIYGINCGGFQFSNSHISNAKKNVMLLEGCGKSPRFTNVMFDNALENLIILSGTTNKVQFVQFNNCIFFNIPNNFSGILSNGSAGLGVVDTHINNCEFVFAGATGNKCVAESGTVLRTKINGGFISSGTGGYFVIADVLSEIKNFVGFNPIGVLTPPANPLANSTGYQNTFNVPIKIRIPFYATINGSVGNVVCYIGKTSANTIISSNLIIGNTTTDNPQTIEIEVPSGWFYAFVGTGVTPKTCTIISRD